MPAGKLIFSQLTDWIHPEQFRRCVNRYDGNRKLDCFLKVHGFMPVICCRRLGTG
jgi:hypothetical protein